MIFFSRTWRKLILLAPLGLAACGGPVCHGDRETPMRIYTLYFGRSVDGHDLTADAWKAFRDQVITPAIPAGYTITYGQGAWFNPRTRTTGAEDSIILTTAQPDTPASLAAVTHIRETYVTRFHQQSVGMTAVAGCGDFAPETPLK